MEVDAARLKEVAWYGKSADVGTQVVGRLAANAYGLYDMLGNVWAWCLDKYDSRFYKDGAEDPVNINRNASSCVVRGGSSLAPSGRHLNRKRNERTIP